MARRDHIHIGGRRDLSGSALIVAAGLFALASQAILFRDFLAVFAGSEPAIGAFFGLWLLWIAAGAVCGRAAARRIARWRCFELICLLYIPAFLLGRHLLLDARVICGTAAWEAMTPAQLAAVAAAAPGPLSFLTGALFTAGCAWKQRRAGQPVETVYMLEAAGSFAGGGAVTLGLWLGLSPETIFLAAAGALSAAAAGVAIAERRPPLGAIPLAAAIAVIGFGLDGTWAASRRRTEWRRLMAAGGFRGSFSTARAEYVYGERDGRFTVLSRTSTVEALPDREGSAPVAAMAMAQNPSARRVLVAGTSAYPLCRRLLAFPTIERVTWIGADPEYPPHLRAVLPERYRAHDPRLHVPETDARAFVRSGGREYDLAVLDFPDPTTLHLNRYYTREFFRALRDRLGPDGAVCISITGGANYLSPAAADMGGSIYRTLRDVFGNTAIKAGEQTWLFASAGGAVSDTPADLADRFFGIENADNVFPRGGFASLFETARVEKQKEVYAAAAAAGRALPNTDAHPRALAYAVRLAARRSGLPGAGEAIGLLGIAGIPIAAAGLGILFLLRLLYRLLEGGRRRAGRGAAGLDSSLLVATAGASGIGLNVVLMCRLENAGNSIFLLVGLVSSLAMLGMAAGASLAGRIFFRFRRPAAAAAVWMAAHVGLLAAIALLETDPPLVLLCALFFAGGFLAAGYIPLVAAALAAAGRDPAAAGGRIETADHAGGAAGAATAGLLLVPLLGMQTTLLALAALVATNGVIFLPRLRRRGALTAAPRLRAAGWVMFGGAVFLLVAAHLAAGARRPEETAESPVRIFHQVAGKGTPEEMTGTWNGTDFRYLAVSDCPALSATGGEGWFFTTRTLAPDVWGFRGRIVLALLADREGRLARCAVLESREDETYFRPVEQWIPRRLEGRNLFDPRDLRAADAVSGATVSSRAVVETAAAAGRRFAAAVGIAAPRAADDGRGFAWTAYLPPAVLLAFLAGAAVMRLFPSRPLRAAVLAIAAAGLGCFLNLQFSTAQALSLCGLQLPPAGFTAAFLLAAAVPAAVLLLGNVFCGWICPFGALQELIGAFRPRRMSLEPPRRLVIAARFVKYVILFILVCWFALTFDRRIGATDPLMTAFGFETWLPATVVFIALIAILSFYYQRFWCRYLCPAGAFLAILNYPRTALLTPRNIVPGRCDLGVAGRGELDCIRCDRCRHAQAARPRPGGTLKGVLFIAVLCAAAGAAAWNAAERVAPRAANTARPVPGFAGPRGPVDTRTHEHVDTAAIRRLIREGKLSGREALYYRQEDETADGPARVENPGEKCR